MSSKNEPRLTKAERTTQAREQAKKIREAQLKKEKKRNWMIRGGVLLAAVAIVVVIALIMVQTAKNNEPVADSGPVPTNANQYGGVTLGKNAAVIAPAVAGTTVDKNNAPAQPTAAATAVADPGKIGIAAAAAGKPGQVVIYLDFMCPACKNFESSYGSQIDALREEGKITVEYRALPFLDRFSSGTNYSSRSAAAAACVVNESPESYKKFVDSLYANAPEENSKGLDNAKLEQLATDAGAKSISSCVDAKTYRPFVQYTGLLASGSGVNATPTVFVQGKQWNSQTDGDFIAFLNKTIAAK